MSEAVATVSPSTTLSVAAEIMVEGKLGCLPVLNGKELVGIITEADFVKAFSAGNLNY